MSTNSLSHPSFSKAKFELAIGTSSSSIQWKIVGKATEPFGALETFKVDYDERNEEHYFGAIALYGFDENDSAA